MIVRSSASQMPGMLFTDYQTTLLLYQSLYGIPVLITEDTYKTMLDQTWAMFTERGENFKAAIDGYGFTDDIPKEKCFVKLKAGTSAYDEAQIISGLQSVLTNRDIVVMQNSLLIATMNQVGIMFQLFVAIIAVIALFIAFFLLMISTTSNVEEAIWEYGVLRSIGLTKD